MICTSRLADRVLAEDVRQETWLAARQSLARFQGTHVRAWLFAIAFHKIADAARGSGAAEAFDSQIAAGSPYIDPPTTPSRKLARKQDLGRLLHWLEGLTPAQRELFELRFVDGLMPAAIASRLAAQGEDVSADAIAQRLHRLVVQLRQSLEHA